MPKVDPSPFQFTVRTLLLLVTLFSLPLSWFGAEFRRARGQRETLMQLRKVGGYISYDYKFDWSNRRSWEKRTDPAWLWKLLGDDFLARARSLTMQGSNVTDAELAHLKVLTSLKNLHLLSTDVTDAGLVELEGLAKL